MNLCDETALRVLLARHGFHFSKSKGQNFLIADWVPERIARESGAAADAGVLEIGPGVGALTVQLARLAGRVTAVELDKSLAPLLAETLADCPNTEVLFADVLQLDLPALVRERFSGLRPMVCANLPYNITTPVLTALLEAGCFDSLTVMVQREVARRLSVPVGSGDGGAFAVWVQYHAAAELLFDVPPECFLPAPKVTSSVLRLTPYAAPPVSVTDEALFFRTVRAAFALRRKTLVNSLAAGLSMEKDRARELILSCGLDPSVRGERLTMEDFAKLTAAQQIG
ncbi:MAG: ribosomal RNA small subunit methyltransferase A [Oscillospiraceae bacterium]|nr:ribosomal RNA small subunit methyltransferase A [Oscillospiraceae bacterium]